MSRGISGSAAQAPSARARRSRLVGIEQGHVARRPAPKRVVLLVEDDWDARELYGRYLRSHGMQVEAATDGVQALRLAETLHLDIVVMDLSLPHLDGWEATRRLRHDPRTRHVPIIACSGHVFGTSVDLALDAGCDAYVVKPCLPKDLLAEIRRLLAGGPS